MRAQVVAKRELIRHLRVINCAGVHVMGAHYAGILAKVKTSGRPGDFGVETFAPDTIPKFLHFGTESVDGPGFFENNEYVNDGLCDEPGNRRTADVMNGH